MRFVKMHGLGNDYVYVNGFEQTVPDPQETARRISVRHLGVGADGLILVLPPDPDDGQAHLRMRMFNADGSEAEMCGNGVRCVCKLAHDYGISTNKPMLIQTGNGVLTLDYTLDANGKVDQVTVDMGAPILEPKQIPVDISDQDQVVNYALGGLIELTGAPMGDQWSAESGLDKRMTCVSMGNPHVVLFCRDVWKVPLQWLGPQLESHPVSRKSRPWNL